MHRPDTQQQKISRIRSYYNSVYHARAKSGDIMVSGHLRRLATKLNIHKGQHILDVACGTGQWLLACTQQGAVPTGIDISKKAIAICKGIMPDGDFRVTRAEQLPFDDHSFDVVSCLGALEHFLDPAGALAEITRVAGDDALILLLVPNADFLTRRLGLYRGTDQVSAKEDLLTLEEWKMLFENSRLSIVNRWKDLHVLSRWWIFAGKWQTVPIRLLQASILPFWPLKWQYQVYHLCRKRNVIDRLSAFPDTVRQ